MTKNAKFLIASVLVFLFSIYTLSYLGFYQITAWWVPPTVGLLVLCAICSLWSIAAGLLKILTVKFWLAEGGTRR